MLVPQTKKEVTPKTSYRTQNPVVRIDSSNKKMATKMYWKYFHLTNITSYSFHKINTMCTSMLTAKYNIYALQLLFTNT